MLVCFVMVSFKHGFLKTRTVKHLCVSKTKKLKLINLNRKNVIKIGIKGIK